MARDKSAKKTGLAHGVTWTLEVQRTHVMGIVLSKTALEVFIHLNNGRQTVRLPMQECLCADQLPKAFLTKEGQLPNKADLAGISRWLNQNSHLSVYVSARSGGIPVTRTVTLEVRKAYLDEVFTAQADYSNLEGATVAKYILEHAANGSTPTAKPKTKK